MACANITPPSSPILRTTTGAVICDSSMYSRMRVGHTVRADLIDSDSDSEEDGAVELALPRCTFIAKITKKAAERELSKPMKSEDMHAGTANNAATSSAVAVAATGAVSAPQEQRRAFEPLPIPDSLRSRTSAATTATRKKFSPCWSASCPVGCTVERHLALERDGEKGSQVGTMSLEVKPALPRVRWGWEEQPFWMYVGVQTPKEYVQSQRKFS